MNLPRLATSLIPLVAHGILVGSVILTPGCCKKPKKESFSTEPSAAASVAPKRVIEMIPGSDEPPSTWSSPHESKAAAPDFAQADGYAPQLSEEVKAQLFAMSEGLDASPAQDASPSPCLVVCSVTGHKDVDGGVFKLLSKTEAPDMDVHVTLETDLDLLERGPDDQRKVFVSIPLVDCSARKRWKFHLVDRDELGTDDMGTTHVTPPFPLEKKDAVADIVCRALSRDRVERELEKALPTCDAKLNAMVEWMRVDPQDPSLGVEPVLTKMREAVSDLAGWVGWADPRVVRRREWGLRILTAIQQDRLAFVKKHASRNPERVTFRHKQKDFEVSRVSVDCHSEKLKAYQLREEKKRPFPKQPPKQPRSPAKGSASDNAAQIDPEGVYCLLTLEVRHLGGQILAPSFGEPFTWRSAVARDDGETVRPRLLGVKEHRPIQDPNTQKDGVSEGAEATVVLGLPPLAFADGKKPVLMVLNPIMDGRTVFIPLPHDAPASGAPSP